MTDTLYDDADLIDDAEFSAGGGSGVGRLEKALARQSIDGDLSEQQLATIGSEVVDDWNRDLASNKDWRDKAEEALKVAAQETPVDKTYPFRRASNVKYPLLTISAMAFHARAYPGIVKGDEAIKVKTFGKDRDGKKQARALRMAEYLNYLLFYKVDGWEADTDSFLLRLPILGQHFRKVYHDPITGETVVESISALRLTVPADAPSLERSPRITHDFDRYPHELKTLMRSGDYRTITLDEDSDDSQASRLILEQHRMMDLDDDGLEEPYIVTVDHSTAQVLRIEEAWDEDGVTTDGQGRILAIKRWCPFVSYPFIPDPKGRAYGIGFGHLLTPIMDVVNTNINLMIDAGHAQVAGGGFVSAEVRLQGAGQNGKLTFQPGEYKTVNATAGELRNAIYERTFPNPSPVLFQLLGMLMEAAKDIASVNDAITGDSARTAPVGTTLALIEQGQQVFNAIYKRIYRALRSEFRLFAECQKKYGDPAQYARFCDAEPEAPQGPVEAPEGQPGMLPAPVAPMDPEALFRADFDDEDLDVQPVSDPTTITRMQMMARAQFVMSMVPTGQVDPKAAVKRALQAAAVDDIDELMTPPAPPPPNPVQIQMMALEAAKKEAETRKMDAGAQLDTAKAAEIANRNTGAQADLEAADKASQIQQRQLETFRGVAEAMGPGSFDSDPEVIE